MTRIRNSQRGEGKVGCVVSLLVLVVVGAAAMKIVPVLYSNNELAKSAEEVASRGALLTQENIEAQVRAKAKELEVPEALAPGAIIVSRTLIGAQGNCSVTLRYTRKIDLYGVFSFDITTNSTKLVPIYTN